MSQDRWDENLSKKAQQLRYVEYLTGLIRESYDLLKKTGELPSRNKYFIEGVMVTGKYLGVPRNDLEDLLETINQEVFGMSIEERKKAFQESAAEDDTDYESPTFVRMGKKLSF